MENKNFDSHKYRTTFLGALNTQDYKTFFSFGRNGIPYLKKKKKNTLFLPGVGEQT